MSHVHLPMDDRLVSYIRDVSPPEPDFLRRLREETAQLPLGRMQITREQGRFLQVLVRILNARRVLEIGVFTGYSSVSMALALPAEGRLLACDVSEEFTSIARRYWAEAGVAAKIELRLAPALDTLAAAAPSALEDPFDLVFIDADKANYRNYFDACLPLVRPGGLIAVDNTLWHGDVADPENREPDTVAIRDFNLHVRNDARVYSCLLPIGDGLTLACKL
jgi:O-methyltransferase